MNAIQIVIDTNVLYSALRWKQGASFRLLSLLGSDKFEINLSVPLVVEYEEVLKRKLPTLTLSEAKIDQFLDYLCQVGNWRKVFFLWRPFLKDTGDDMILELALNCGCQHIVTYNKSDFEGVNQFNLKLSTPKEFLQTIQEIP